MVGVVGGKRKAHAAGGEKRASIHVVSGQNSAERSIWTQQESSTMDVWLLIRRKGLSLQGPVHQSQIGEFEFPLGALNMADSVQ
jgi:hypothetical protein